MLLRHLRQSELLNLKKALSLPPFFCINIKIELIKHTKQGGKVVYPVDATNVYRGNRGITPLTFSLGTRQR